MSDAIEPTTHRHKPTLLIHMKAMYTLKRDEMKKGREGNREMGRESKRGSVSYI